MNSAQGYRQAYNGGLGNPESHHRAAGDGSGIPEPFRRFDDRGQGGSLMCEHCAQAMSRILTLGKDEGALCEECSGPAAWVHITKSVCFHLCDEHVKSQQEVWTGGDEAYFQTSGLNLTTEFLPIAAEETCGYRLFPTPANPQAVCGKKATHVEIDTDRHFYCEEHRPE
jgi:hypothetical protein